MLTHEQPPPAGRGTTTRLCFLLAAALAVIVGCSGSESTAVAPTPTVAISDELVPPTSTPIPPTPSPTATSTPTSEPTAAPTPEADPREAEVIAAWERYLTLSAEASGKNPSIESKDLTSFVSGDALTGLTDGIARRESDGVYLDGVLTSSDPTVTFRSDGQAVIADCIATETTVRSLTDDSAIRNQALTDFQAQARLALERGIWLVNAVDFGDQACE